jgi:hypothetical protein
MTKQGSSIATEHCYRALRLAMRLVRPRTDGRNGLTKKVFQLVDKSHLSNARKIRSDSAPLAATGTRTLRGGDS